MPRGEVPQARRKPRTRTSLSVWQTVLSMVTVKRSDGGWGLRVPRGSSQEDLHAIVIRLYFIGSPVWSYARTFRGQRGKMTIWDWQGAGSQTRMEAMTRAWQYLQISKWEMAWMAQGAEVGSAVINSGEKDSDPGHCAGRLSRTPNGCGIWAWGQEGMNPKSRLALLGGRWVLRWGLCMKGGWESRVLFGAAAFQERCLPDYALGATLTVHPYVHLYSAECSGQVRKQERNERSTDKPFPQDLNNSIILCVKT